MSEREQKAFVEAMTATAEGILAVPGEEEAKARWARVYAEERAARLAELSPLADAIEKRPDAARYRGLVRALRNLWATEAQRKLAKRLAKGAR